MTVLWIDDANGEIGTVDSVSGAVTLVGASGQPLTDIAFAPQGQLFGITFTSLYSINESNGAATFIGNLRAGAANMNGLEFDSTGTLYAVSGATSQLYTINTTTGQATAISGTLPAYSEGDIAFDAGFLYMADSNGNLDRLSVSGGTVSASVVGSIGYSNVDGLATGANGVLYGVSGTQLISISTTSGAGSVVLNYQGHVLSAGYGMASTPAPIAPTVTAVSNVSVAENQSIAGSSLISSITNPSGDAITQYIFKDDGGGTGYFTVNGVRQSDGQWIYPNPGDNVQYVGGPSPGTDTLEVGIYEYTTNSYSYSSTAVTATTTAPTHVPPTVTAVSTVSVSENQAIAGSSLVSSITNPSGDAITQYRLFAFFSG